ncbi:putative transcriptional regulator of N-Acetylglucosamine utilization, GntR family (plasmid) [Priestia megaterium]|uniref:GntR family transcriptional regulator n=1 Tax=Priestia megaterium TaxID=1404 RepID=UPI0015DC3956|nr:GntR family transcriptional regulator [Priestia megaterium]QLK08829.1 putative transcriptional regulator of N-Acetylglucosamine utilization, GntR family [Priestia megaterium]
MSRLTVRQSIQELVDEGYLSKQRGRGTFILEKKIEQKLLTTTSFTSLMEEQGKVPRNETLSIEKFLLLKLYKESFILANIQRSYALNVSVLPMILL